MPEAVGDEAPLLLVLPPADNCKAGASALSLSDGSVEDTTALSVRIVKADDPFVWGRQWSDAVKNRSAKNTC